MHSGCDQIEPLAKQHQEFDPDMGKCFILSRKTEVKDTQSVYNSFQRAWYARIPWKILNSTGIATRIPY